MPADTDLDVVRTWKIGAVEVSSVLEMPPLAADPARFVSGTRDDVLQHREWLVPDFADESGDIVMHFQAFIVETPTTRILVDPCFGNDKHRDHTSFRMLSNPFLERLTAAGFAPETFDYVLCTHLHADHCGWNTRLVGGSWVPTFENAEYLFVTSEYEYAKAGGHGDALAILADSVAPVVNAGLARFVEAPHDVTGEVHLEPTPGHTPGHSSVVITSQGQEAIITGDLIHHPVQLARPTIGDNFCWDQEQAQATRRRVIERAATRGALLLGSHFAGLVGVYVQADGQAWRVAEAATSKQILRTTAAQTATTPRCG